MAFVDEGHIYVEAGKGGDGVVRWRREIYVPKGGPAGGDGGRGGSVYAKAVRGMHSLQYYRSSKKFKAKDGDAGGGNKMHGADGESVTLEFPLGTRIKNLDTGAEFFLETEGQTERLVKGGIGGKGNDHFKSSTNVAPRQFTEGKPGEEGHFSIELELFADVGLVGLPNAGKSSMLNALTNAQAKIGDYAFTTLDPNLGDFYGHIIADIPGLIEGASEGKGLGIKFLKHIKRTRMLAHLISFENELTKTGGMMKVYKQIRKELETFDKNQNANLSDKKEIIVLTKYDVIPDDVQDKMVEKKIAEFKKLGNPVFVVSLFDDTSVKSFADGFVKVLGK